jgi:hypothetical protein
MPTYILDITEDANEDLSYYRAFERKVIVDVAEADDFDQEVEQLRNSLAFQQFPDERSAYKTMKRRISLNVIAREIEAELAAQQVTD